MNLIFLNSKSDEFLLAFYRLLQLTMHVLQIWVSFFTYWNEIQVRFFLH